MHPHRKFGLQSYLSKELKDLNAPQRVRETPESHNQPVGVATTRPRTESHRGLHAPNPWVLKIAVPLGGDAINPTTGH